MESIFTLQDEGFWLLILWPFASGLVLYKMPQQTIQTGGVVVCRWYWLTAMLLAFPYILWAGYRGNMIDTGAYVRGFLSSNYTIWDIPRILREVEKDVGFTVLVSVLKTLGIRTRVSFLMTIAAIQILCMVRTFRRYSPNYWISMFLFVASTDYVAWMCNGIRQFLAVCLIFAAFDLLVERKFILFSLVVLISSTIHGSALLMLPFAYVMNGPALNRKTMLAILATALVIPFVDRFLPAFGALLEDTQYNDIMTEGGIWENDDGTNMLRVTVYSIPALVALFGRRYFRGRADRVMNLCINASIISMVIYFLSSVTSGVYIGRIPIYTTLYGYMSLPWLLDQIFEKRTVRLITFLMILCYVIFFYYQMAHAWDFIPEVL